MAISGKSDEAVHDILSIIAKLEDSNNKEIIKTHLQAIDPKKYDKFMLGPALNRLKGMRYIERNSDNYAYTLTNAGKAKLCEVGGEPIEREEPQKKPPYDSWVMEVGRGFSDGGVRTVIQPDGKGRM